ncbi:MAG: cell division ATPase MinD [Candidatus Aenigmatarchaeota archaeon]
MTRIISVISGKGGTGKTMITANLGIALAEMGKDVTIVDGNLTTPNLGLHLGIPLFPKSLHDVLKGRAKIKDAIYEHDSGLKIVPAGIGLNDLKGINIRNFSNILLGLLGNTDFVILDGAAGLGREAIAAMENSDEVLLITNPELPAVLDAMKAAKIAEEVGANVLGVVINRITNKKHELTDKEIRDLLDLPIIAKISEDEDIRKSITMKIPIIKYKPNSSNSIELRMLASFIAGESFEYSLPWYKRIFSFFR